MPHPPQPAKPGRGRPKVYSDRLFFFFLKALVILLIEHLSKVYELLGVLEQPTAEMHAPLLTTHRMARTRLGGPSRAAPQGNARDATGPERSHAPGARKLLESIEPWARCGRAAALDSTLLRARGGVWHKKRRGRCPTVQ
jgi:hypothetical protein